MKYNSFLNLVLILTAVLAVTFLLFQDTSTQDTLAAFLGLKKEAQSIQKNKKNNSSVIEFDTVIWVVDGDTIVLVSGRTIRYLNVDTPETKKPNTQVQCYGPEASAFNKSLVDGKKVILKSDKQLEDRYGRDLRFVFLDNQDASNIENSINALLVKEGYGRALIIKPNNTYENYFNQLQFQSKTNKSGLWGKCSNPFVE